MTKLTFCGCDDNNCFGSGRSGLLKNCVAVEYHNKKCGFINYM